MKTYLHIGAGKVDLEKYNAEHIHVFLDKSYSVSDNIDNLVTAIRDCHKYVPQKNHFFIRMDVFEFMDSFPFQFDHAIAERIFEHMFYDSGEIGRLLDACNQITKDDGSLTIVVPNHYRLCEIAMELEDDPRDNSKILLVNTEFMNTRCDPHGSYWSPRMAYHYIGNEGNIWKISDIQDKYWHKGRDIYMKILLEKKKQT